jgi:hypothetical protein
VLLPSEAAHCASDPGGGGGLDCNLESPRDVSTKLSIDILTTYGNSQGHGLNSFTLHLGGSRQPSEIPHGRLADSVQTKGVWGFGDPQFQIHEHRAHAQVDLETFEGNMP